MKYTGSSKRWYCASCNEGFDDYFEWKFDHKEGNHGVSMAAIRTPDKTVEQSEPTQPIPRTKLSSSLDKKVRKIALSVFKNL